MAIKDYEKNNYKLKIKKSGIIADPISDKQKITEEIPKTKL